MVGTAGTAGPNLCLFVGELYSYSPSLYPCRGEYKYSQSFYSTKTEDKRSCRPDDTCATVEFAFSKKHYRAILTALHVAKLT